MDPPLTYRGALQLLGKHDRPVFDVLNSLLGGVLLGGPLAGAAALFGWIDQKNEAMGIVRKLLDAGKNRLLGTNGYERQQLIAAAHTVLVISSFLDALAELTGIRPDRERLLAAVAPSAAIGAVPVVERLYRYAIPMPTGATGFVENLGRVRFDLSILAMGMVSSDTDERVVELAASRYEAAYHKLAADVPEFWVWAALGEHAATRNTMRDLHAGLGETLGAQALALGRLERLLDAFVGDRDRPAAATRDLLARANRAVLTEDVVSADAARHAPAVRFPTVASIHQTPAFRDTYQHPGARPADDGWWAELPLVEGLDLYLAAHLASPASTKLPLLVLGHPGAGKSLLTKVLAARLPVESYTVVRVPLRRVDAGAPVYTQIQEALDGGTHARVDWGALVEESAETIRVVLLDGLDELLQANPSGRPGYLQECAEFQRREAAIGHPVAVVVTSRTIVADRARIPDGTPIVRLEEFREPEIRRWVEEWNAANREPIGSGAVRALPVDTALAQTELTRQPLLLLMLALYLADPGAPGLDAHLSGAALYERLFDAFVRREVAKTDVGEDVDEAVDERLWRLTVAAFGMFNRGGQYIVDTELGADLTALDRRRGAPSTDVRRLGQRTVGEFFFVHTAESDAHRRGEARQSYEFLHATFGEYLVARHTVQVLTSMARSGRDGYLTDDELFALLSHQPLAGRLSILTFAADLVAALPKPDRRALNRLLERLSGGVRDRHGSDRFATYRPLPVDRLRELAVYSVNLVTLRVLLDPDRGGVPIAAFAPDGAAVTPWWHSTVRSWRAGLDDAGWVAVVEALDVAPPHDDPEVFDRLHDVRAGTYEVDACRVVRRWRWVSPQEIANGYAQLMVDPVLERDLRVGARVSRQSWYFKDDEWSETELLAWAAGTAVHDPDQVTERWDAHIWDGARARVAAYRTLAPRTVRMVARALAANAGGLDDDQLRILAELAASNGRDAPELAMVVAAHPWLLRDVPALCDPAVYTIVMADKRAEIVRGIPSTVVVWLAAACDGSHPTGEDRQRLNELLTALAREEWSPLPGGQSPATNLVLNMLWSPSWGAVGL